MAGCLGPRGLALLDQIVAILNGRSGLLAGPLESAACGVTAARGAARPSQQNTQTKQCDRTYHDAVQDSVPVEPVT